MTAFLKKKKNYKNFIVIFIIMKQRIKGKHIVIGFDANENA